MKKCFTLFACLLLIALVLLTTGCPDNRLMGDKYGLYKSPNYILMYQYCSKMELIQEGNSIRIRTYYDSDGDIIYVPGAYVAPREVTPFTNKTVFDSLAAKHNDVNYTGEFWILFYDETKNTGMITYGEPSANMQDVDSISITCDSCWNATHPAGASLTDITKLETRSYRQYIRSGYDLSATSDGGELSTQNILISEMTPEDYELILYIYGRLSFTALPEKAGVYPVTVSVSFDDGGVFTKKCNFNYSPDA